MKTFMRWCASLGLALLTSAAVTLGSDVATLEFLDVGQGDAILIRSPEGKTALVDAGPSNHVAGLLRQRGVRTLDLAVVSHHHADHHGGMAEVVKEFHPRVFLASSSAHTSTHYLHLLEQVRASGARAVVPAHDPRRILLGTVEILILPQAPEDAKEENNNSIGLRVRYGTVSFLLPGDAEETERRWWEEHAGSLVATCDILKLAHHGSRNGTDATWLGYVRPKLTVASLGKDNEFGHPHPETLALLARDRIPLLRTDQNGSIRVETDGRGWRVLGHPIASRGPPSDATPSGRRSRREGSSGSSIDLNRASEESLRTIPGIGPVLARRIIAGRPYSRVDDLADVEGIGKKRLAQIRPYVRVE